jgi:predicted amidohydrolase
MVTVAALQHDIVWEDRDATLARLAPQIADAAARGARLVVLTEMYATGFSMDTARIAEPEGGPSSEFLADQAVAHGIWVCGSVPEHVPGTPLPTNCLVLAGPAGERYRYHKIHPFTYAREHERYGAGTAPLTVDVERARVSLFVCYDLRFADEFWALANDTDLYVVVANWPAPRREHWRTLLRARAIENQAYVLGVNRVGAVRDLDHVGDSAIIDPLGRTLVEASIGEAVLTAEVTPQYVHEVRETLPFLRDRR